MASRPPNLTCCGVAESAKGGGVQKGGGAPTIYSLLDSKFIRRAAISRFRQKASQKASKRRAVGTTSPGALSFAKGKSPAGEKFFGGPEVFSNRKIAISARFSPSRVIYLIYFRSIFCSIFVLSCCCSVLLTKSIPKGVISVAPLRVL